MVFIGTCGEVLVVDTFDGDLVSEVAIGVIDIFEVPLT